MPLIDTLFIHPGRSDGATQGYKIRIINTNFADIESIRVFIMSILVKLSSLLGDPAKSLHPIPVDCNDSSCRLSMKISVIAEIRLPRSVMATSLSDCQRDQSHWALSRGYRQDAALWWHQLPRELLENALNCGQARCLDPLRNISTSFIGFLSKDLLAN
jgi:hypothetical protein